MGLANLVPGISGGTMLVAAGVYPAFIGAISDVSRLRFRFRPVLTLVCVAFAAAAAIVLLAGPVKDLVVDHRWIMYAMFIGLTLGGAPVVAAMAGFRSGSAPLPGSRAWLPWRSPSAPERVAAAPTQRSSCS